jgi:16S rRNA (adenine1518-N6/adenine1519-N6)-dimethyltransferase
VIALLSDNGLRPSRALGQNFVVDPNTVRRIARLVEVGPGDQVLEIGAGLGSLTLALVATGAKVLACEVDRGLVPVLRSVVEPAGAHVLVGDAMTLDWTAELERAGTPGSPWTLVANLPYNIATPLVVTLLEEVSTIERMLVMVQREVGERLAAGPGEDPYGAVSVKVDWFAEASVVGSVSPEVFLPRPNVDSALVSLRRRPRPPVPPEEAGYDEVMRLVRAGFAVRRKMLRRALAGLVAPDAYVAAGIDPTARAETLGVLQWCRLARCQREIATSPPPS